MNSDVSIIVTNYNYGRYIPRCLRSCIDQFGHKPQIIVVDDCSDDNSIKKIEAFANDVILVRNEKNLGVAESSNIGIKRATGQFVIRVDADDYINENLCHFMRTYMIANHDAFCLSCDYILVDDYENAIERKYAEKDPISCGIMYRKDLLLDFGGYNPHMRHREEEELRKRLGIYYKIHNLKIPFYRYRMHTNNKTKQKEYDTWKI